MAQQYLDGHQRRRRDRAHPRHSHARRDDAGRRPPGLAHESGRLEAAKRCDPVQQQPVMQFGVASARIEEKVKLMGLGPDMMAVAFNAHDEYFNPDPQFPPKRMMAIHPVEELLAYAKAAERAQGEARSRMLPHRRVLEPRIHPQAGLPRRTPTRRCSSAGRAALGRRRPRRHSSTWSTTCRRTAFGT